MFQNKTHAVKQGLEDISTLKIEIKSLQEKLSETTDQLALTGEEKNEYKKLADKLEKEKKEVEDKSEQQEKKIKQLVILQQEVILLASLPLQCLTSNIQESFFFSTLSHNSIYPRHQASITCFKHRSNLAEL